MKSAFGLVLAATLFGLCGCLGEQRVGETADGGSMVPTHQKIQPAGKTTAFEGRPVDLLSIDDSTAVALDNRGIVVFNSVTSKVVQELSLSGGTSLNGLAWSASKKTLYVSGAGSSVGLAVRGETGFAWKDPIALPEPKVKGATYPIGLSLSPDERYLYVCASRSNQLLRVDLSDTKKIDSVDVGVCPYGVTLNKAGTMAYVSCWAPSQPKKGVATAKSAGSDVEVDERGIGTGGMFYAINLAKMSVTGTVPVGLQPCEIVLSPDEKTAYVANANSDTVSEIALPKVTKTKDHTIKMQDGLGFGSAPNALALSPDVETLYVATGGNNALALFDLKSKKVTGWIPTGWFPSAVTALGKRIVVASAKGYGSRGGVREQGGRSVYSFLGTLSVVEVPESKQLMSYTAAAMDQARVLASLAALQHSAYDVDPVAIPLKLGGPSHIQHVFYVIKENRTYDQIFGDMPNGEGDIKLCTYGRDITPNHHALADEFVLLDNFYCNGVNSADGHSWVTEGNATAYFEHTFGGWTRSYPFGDDPLATSSSGFIWDNVLKHGLSFRNYGEFDYTEPAAGQSFKQIYDDFVSGENKVAYKNNMGVERLRNYSNLSYPGWNMGIPDVVRASIFIKDLQKADQWPHFTIIYLPQDHTSGTAPGMPTPIAHMADNDLALGRVIEAISGSKFWPKSAIFVIEDDPQAGTDHVDGHRSICIVVSPYARRKAVVSDFFSQTSVLHTMERILGIPPMNQMDAMAPVMFSCFTDKPDLTPFKALPANHKLDELNPAASTLKGEARRLALLSAKQNWEVPDAVDDDAMNRANWSSLRPGTRYPSEWAGAHGKGLAKRKLTLGPED